MKISNLRNLLKFVSNPKGGLQVILYACFSGSIVKKLDVEREDLPPIAELFAKNIREKVDKRENYSIIPLSTADSRSKCFYEYDLDLPEELVPLVNVIGKNNMPKFNFKEDKISDIEALLVVLADNEHEVSLYKRLAPVEVIGRGGYMLWKAEQRFERFRDQMLRINGSFHVLSVSGKVVVLDLGVIEKMLGFTDVIRREAALGITAIEKMEIVSDIESLEGLVNDLRFARKLVKIARESPVIKNNISNKDIIRFSQEYPATRGKMKYTSDGAKFVLNTKRSKELFIRMLNDDYLTSKLTKLNYASLAKDNVEVELNVS